MREAARQSAEALPATDLAAIVTTSGLVQSPMTVDRGKFYDALAKLRAERAYDAMKVMMAALAIAPGAYFSAMNSSGTKMSAWPMT